MYRVSLAYDEMFPLMCFFFFLQTAKLFDDISNLPEFSRHAVFKFFGRSFLHTFCAVII